MYSFQIKNSEIFSSQLNENIQSKIEEIKIHFQENLINDLELLKTMYVDNIEVLLNCPKKEKIAFRINFLYEFEVNKNYYNIVQELKIPEVCESEFNHNKNSDIKYLNLPYYVSFFYDGQYLQLDIFLFWMKKSHEFYENFSKILFTEIKDEIYFTSIFFSLIELIKNNLLAPDKNYLLYILQEINEISMIKANKDSFFKMIKEFYLKRKRSHLYNDKNVIFNDLSIIDEFQSNIENIQRNFPPDEDEFCYNFSNNLNVNNYTSDYNYNNENEVNNKFDLSQIKKRSDRLLENSLNKKNFIDTNKINSSSEDINEIDTKEYQIFFSLGGICGEVISDRGSSFQAHAIRIEAFDQVVKLTKILLTNNKIQKATHNIMAYRFSSKENSNLKKEDEKDKDKGKAKVKKDLKNIYITEGFDDDGETGAGVRLLGILQKMRVYNVFVVVSRWFGGTMLGNDRFKHINDTAKDLLLENKNKFEFEN